MNSPAISKNDANTKKKTYSNEIFPIKETPIRSPVKNNILLIESKYESPEKSDHLEKNNQLHNLFCICDNKGNEQFLYENTENIRKKIYELEQFSNNNEKLIKIIEIYDKMNKNYWNNQKIKENISQIKKISIKKEENENFLKKNLKLMN